MERTQKTCWDSGRDRTPTLVECPFIDCHLYQIRGQWNPTRTRARQIMVMVPYLATLIKSFLRTSIPKVSRSLQIESRFSAGTEKRVASNRK